MVSFDRFNIPAEAYRGAGRDGQRGASRRGICRGGQGRSHGPTAINGGATTGPAKGSLVSKVLDEAIFSLCPSAA